VFSKVSIGCFVWLFGCGGLKSYNSTDTGDGETDRYADDADTPSAPDDTASSDSIRYPSGIQSSILLYTGHGGAVSADPTGRGGFNAISDHWNSIGWNTEVSDTFPDTPSLDAYRMVGLMAPGFSDTMAFTELEVIKLKTLLHGGARVVVFAEEDTCDNPHLNTLLAELEVSIRFNGDGMGLNSIVYDADITPNQQLTDGVTTVRFTDPCYLDPNDGTVLASRRRADDNRVFMAVERPKQAGDVVVLGDLQVLDDSGALLLENNLFLAENLASVVPE
jgi:hypothetical protein